MIGKTISHFNITKKLGEGGMGVVYKAEDARLKRTVAIKFLPRQIAASDEERARFKIEAQAAAALNHPNIATIHAIEEHDDETRQEPGTLFIVMEYIDGKELANLPKVLNLREVMDYATQIAAGLQAAHEKGVVHRDIKSSNIMITDKGQVKIMDFGLAKVRGGVQVTKVGTTLGTAAYMSPEQARGEEVDQRTDIWAFGVVLYEMLTGELPFKGDYEQAITYSILNEDPKPVTALRSGIPMELERIVNKCLEKTPAERYQHVDELLVDLSAVSKQSEFGTSKKPGTQTKPVPRKRLYPYAGLSTLAALLLLMLYFWPLKGDRIDAIAVLPLQNLSGDPEREFFTDGLTESLIMELSKISSLRVISRQSVMRYKQTDKSMPEIASELNVDAVVAGSALRIGDTVRITVQLIQAEPEQHLWAEQYDQNIQDILKLQSEVAQAIAREIKVAVTPEETQRMAMTAPINPEAHEHYLRGRFFLNKLEKTSLQKAMESFQNAIDIEKEYAPAYVGQAQAYQWLVHLGEIPPSEGYPKMKKLALQAIDIGGELAEAYTILGELSDWVDWDWETGRRYLEKAIALNRNYARAHSGYSWYLLRRKGQTDQAINEIGIAYGLDPYSNRIKFEYGLMLYFARRYRDAIRVLRELLEVSPDYTETPVILGLSYMRIGRYQDAIKQIQDFTALTGDTLTALSKLIPVYAAMGDTMKARELFSDYMLRFKETKASMFGKEAPTIARVYATLNEKDKAFDWLEKAYNERNRYLSDIKIDPEWDPLRSDPRYKALLRKMGLE